jgi:hypothetical protein
MMRRVIIALLAIGLIGGGIGGGIWCGMNQIGERTARVYSSWRLNYVGDVTTGVFHKRSCPYASQIKKGNRAFFKTRDKAISAGFTPCPVCKP